MPAFTTGQIVTARYDGRNRKVNRYITPEHFLADDGILYWEGDFRAQPTRKAIVALIENGVPRPSTRPYVHPSRDLAEKESRRLSEQHPGSDFGVYELVAVSNAPKPIASTKAA